MLKKWSHLHFRARTVTKCYYDNVSYDENNRLFYIIHIGRYHNKHTFSVGTTLDLHATVYEHVKTYPVSKCLYQVPIGRLTTAPETFLHHVKSMCVENPLQGPVPQHHQMIAVDDYDYVHFMFAKADEVFKTQKRFGAESNDD